MTVLTPANQLTLLRMLLIPAFVILVVYGELGWALIVFVTAGITDGLDGLLARWSGQHTSLGAWLDPMADKLLLLSSFLVLGYDGAIASWLVALVVVRDVIVVLGYGAVFIVDHEWMEVAPSRLGKLSTFFQLCTLGFALMSLARPALPLATINEIMQGVAAAVTAASGVQYIYRGLLRHQRRGSVTTK